MTADTVATVPTIRLSKMIPARREDVFNAWLDADGMRQWMCPGDIRKTEVDIDARVGGKYRILMHGNEGKYEHTGEYVEINPPERLAFTWVSHNAAGGSLVTIELRDIDGETELNLTHERLPSAESAAQHTSGWTSILDKLAADFAA